MKRTASVFVISLLLIAAIVLLPMLSKGAGTLNFKADEGFGNTAAFSEMLKCLKGETKFADADRSVTFTMAAIIPAVLLFIFSLCGSKPLCIISSLAGIAGMVYSLLQFKASKGSGVAFSDFFGKTSDLSIGVWVVCLLFVIAFICSLAAKRRVKAK